MGTCFQFLKIINKTAINIKVSISCSFMLLFLQGRFLFPIVLDKDTEIQQPGQWRMTWNSYIWLWHAFGEVVECGVSDPGRKKEPGPSSGPAPY